MKHFYLLVLALVVFSCSSDDDSSDDGGSNGSLIRTVKKVDENGIVENQTDYEYNSIGNVTKITVTNYYGEETVTTFQYDSDDMMLSFTEVKIDVFGDVRTEINTLEYDNSLIVNICQDITIESDDSAFDEFQVDKIEFAYNTNQYVMEFTHYYDEDAEFNTCNDVSGISNTEDLEYNNEGNMVRYENSNYVFTPNYLTYTYDNNNHPYRNVKPDVFRKLYGFSTVNNIDSANEYNADNDELLGTVNYNYEYNSSNYPTVLERTYTSVSGTVGQTARYEYTYY